MNSICLEPGCEAPRKVSRTGNVLQRCEKHMQEKWREAKDKEARRKGVPKRVERKAAAVKARPAEPAAKREPVQNDPGPVESDEAERSVYRVNHRLLEHEEAVALSKRIQAGQGAAARIKAGEITPGLREMVADGQAARETMIAHNMRMVYKVARRWRSSDPAIEFDDLVQEGVVGLMKSVDRWEWQRGHRFSTFAMWWITQHISRFIEESGRIRLPVDNGVKRKAETQAARERAQVVLELDAPAWDDANSTLAEVVADENAEHVERTALNRVLVDKAMRTPMPETWRLVVRDWMDGYTYREAGARHGLSRSIVQAAYGRMREYLGVDLDGA